MPRATMTPRTDAFDKKMPTLKFPANTDKPLQAMVTQQVRDIVTAWRSHSRELEGELDQAHQLMTNAGDHLARVDILFAALDAKLRELERQLHEVRCGG